MRVKKVLERVAMVRPLAFDDEVQMEWVAEIDGQIKQWVDENFNEAVDLSEEYDEDTELFVTHPYERIYELYVLAQADAMGKEEDYNNSAEMFNHTLQEFKKHYHRISKRKTGKPIINIW